MSFEELDRLIREGKAKIKKVMPGACQIEQKGKVVARSVFDPLSGDTIVQGAGGEIARFTDR